MCKILDALKSERVRESLEKRLAESLRVNDETGCIEWVKSAVFNNGYGKISTTREIGPVRAHRLSWILVNGAIPDGYILLHSCDNPKCCNVEHMRVGTKKQNTADMLARDRHFTPFSEMRGERNTNCSISEITAKRIVVAEGSMKDLSTVFSTSRKVISDIKTRKSWKYLHESENTL